MVTATTLLQPPSPPNQKKYSSLTVPHLLYQASKGQNPPTKLQNLLTLHKQTQLSLHAETILRLYLIFSGFLANKIAIFGLSS